MNSLVVVVLTALIWLMVLVVWARNDDGGNGGRVGSGSGSGPGNDFSDYTSDPPFDDDDDDEPVSWEAADTETVRDDDDGEDTETVRDDEPPSCAFDARDGELRTCYTLEGSIYAPQYVSHSYRFNREQCAWEPTDTTLPYPEYCVRNTGDLNPFACARGVIWTLEPTEEFDEFTKAYTRRIRAESNTRSRSDPNYCDDTNEVSVCAQWRKTCLGSAPGLPDQVQFGEIDPTQLNACVIKDCRAPAADCVGEYGAWSRCTRSCGPDGVRAAPKCGYETDPRYDRLEACNRHACPAGCSGFWDIPTSAPSACSKACGGGTQTYNVCATGETVSRACNTHACPPGCDGNEMGNGGWGEWNGTPSQGGGTSYVEQRVLCSDPGGFVQTTTRFVYGFNTDGIRLTTKDNAFVLQLKGAHFDPNTLSSDSRYLISLEASSDHESHDGWNVIHRFELGLDQLDPITESETVVQFADIVAAERYIDELRTYRARITLVDGSTGSTVHEFASFEIQIPLGHLSPVDCVGDWGPCFNGVKAYEVSRWPRYGGKSCDYQDQQRGLCGQGETNVVVNDELRFGCGYYMSWVDFGSALRNAYRVTEWDDRYGYLTGGGNVNMPIMFGLFIWGYRDGNVLRPTFDRGLTHVYHQRPPAPDKPWEEWRIDGEILAGALVPDSPYKRCVIYFERTDSVHNSEERCCIRMTHYNGLDYYLRFFDTSEFTFQGNRAFRVTWTPRVDIENGPHADEACWFFLRSHAMILNGQAQMVRQWFTYVGGLVVGLNTIGTSNRQMFAAYEGDSALGLTMAFELADPGCVGTTAIQDGTERCVMSLWSHANKACDASNCTIQQTRRYLHGATDCGPTSRTVSCAEAGVDCPCVADPWTDSGSCSLDTCTRPQTREVIRAECGDTQRNIACSVEGDWSDWSVECDCTNKKRKRTRTICRDGVQSIQEEFQDCSVDELKEQCCSMSEWGPWGYTPDLRLRYTPEGHVAQEANRYTEGACSQSCGGGWQYAYRNVINRMPDTYENRQMCADKYLDRSEYTSKGRRCNETPCERAVEYACDLYNTPEGHLQSAYIRDAGLGIATNKVMLRSLDRSTLQSRGGLRFNQIPDITDHGMFLLQNATNPVQCLVSKGNMYDPAKGALEWKPCIDVQGKRDWYANWRIGQYGNNTNVLENGGGGFLKPHNETTWIVSNHNKPGNMLAAQITNWDDGRLYDCYAFEASDASAVWKANPTFGEERINLSQFQ